MKKELTEKEIALASSHLDKRPVMVRFKKFMSERCSFPLVSKMEESRIPPNKASGALKKIVLNDNLRRRLDGYSGTYLRTAREEYHELDAAAKFVEHLFQEPFHPLKVELVDELPVGGRAAPDGLHITILQEFLSSKRLNPAVHEIVPVSYTHLTLPTKRIV